MKLSGLFVLAGWLAFVFGASLTWAQTVKPAAKSITVYQDPG